MSKISEQQYQDAIRVLALYAVQGTVNNILTTSNSDGVPIPENELEPVFLRKVSKRWARDGFIDDIRVMIEGLSNDEVQEIVRCERDGDQTEYVLTATDDKGRSYWTTIGWHSDITKAHRYTDLEEVTREVNRIQGVYTLSKQIGFQQYHKPHNYGPELIRQAKEFLDSGAPGWVGLDGEGPATDEDAVQMLDNGWYPPVGGEVKKDLVTENMPSPYSERENPVVLNSTELAAVATHFARYVRGYHESSEKLVGPFISDMMNGWNDFKKVVGAWKAKRVYWTWTLSLPFPQPGCDPDGGID